MASVKDSLAQKIRNLPHQDYTQDNNYDRHKELIENINKALRNKYITICDVVESLQNSLTHEKSVERAQGTRFLSEILKSIPNEVINPQELSFLLSFYIDRLKDHHSVIPYVLKGYLVIVMHEHLSEEGGISLLRSLFKDILCQAQIMTDRRIIFNILKQYIMKKKEDNNSLPVSFHEEFLVGFLSAMDGEKDPRNLVLLFSIIPIITSRIEVGKFAEDLFEVVAAYFPIDFIPPKNDPFGISPEDLSLGLRNCLASNDAFAPFCIPLLVEKIESDLISAKNESMLTLISCCHSYSSESMCSHTIVLWDNLRREVIEGTNAELEQLALDALTALVYNLEKGPSTSVVREALAKLSSSAMSECIVHLNHPEHRLMQSAANILFAISSPSKSLTETICLKVLPMLLVQTTIKLEPSAFSKNYFILGRFLEQAANFNLLGEKSLIGHQEKVFSCLHRELNSKEENFSVVASRVICICGVAFEDPQREALAADLVSLLTEEQRKEVRQNYINALQKLNQVNEETISHVMEKIKDCWNASQLQSNLDTLSCLATFSSVEFFKLRDQIWRLFLTRFDGNDTESCLLFADCLIQIATSRNEILENSAIESEFLQTLIEFLLKVICSSSEEDSVLLEKTSLLARLAFHDHNQQFVESLIGALVTRNWNHFSEELAERLSKLKEDKYCYLVYVFELSLKMPSLSNFDFFSQLMTLIGQWAIEAPEWPVRVKAATLFAANLNKLSSDEDVARWAKWALPDEESRKSSSVAQLLGWTVKAIVMRGCDQELLWINRLENMLTDCDLGREASECYKFLLEEKDEIFNLKYGAKIRMLYKQRIFESRLSMLVTQFRSCEGDSRLNSFLAISNQLPHVPPVVLHERLQLILPVLAQGLSFEDASVAASSLSTLCLLLQQSAGEVGSHLPDLLPPLIKLVCAKNMSTRIESLSCLESLANLPTTTIVPYKSMVTRGIKTALNDRKRLVRHSATAAKCAWVFV